MTRASEAKRTSDQIISFTKYTIQAGKRNEFNQLLLASLPDIEADEPGTYSILVIEDEKNEDVTYVTKRFANQAAADANTVGSAEAKVRPAIQNLVKSEEGGVFKEFGGGFLSKDE